MTVEVCKDLCRLFYLPFPANSMTEIGPAPEAFLCSSIYLY